MHDVHNRLSFLFLIYNQALARDGYRCVITGIFNEASVERFPKLVQSGDALVLPLQTARIFSKPTVQDIDPEAREDSQDKLLNKVLFYPWQPNPPSYSPTIQTRTAAGALSILESFGFSKFTKAFKEAGGVHNVWNLLTLEYNLHTLFDSLKLWFEHTEKVRYLETCQSPIHHVHRCTAIEYVPFTNITKDSSTGTLWATIATLTAPQRLSSSAHNLRKHRHPTPFYLDFMQHVLASRTCLAPLNSLTG